MSFIVISLCSMTSLDFFMWKSIETDINKRRHGIRTNEKSE